MKARIVVIAMLACMAGCFGPAARDKTLLPAIQEQWQELRTNAVGDVSAMDAAAETGVGLWGAWAAAKPLVLDGITQQESAGEITPLFAASKREGVRVTDEMVRKWGVR
ncbi:MAG: hypothetical protein PHF37_10185 [Phycisphaerae bacterium]|nr:hypothetical protein [Phycisphaerae bacterium]